MTTKEKLQEDLINAIKNKGKNTVTLLRTILGELDRVSKNPSDKEVDQVIRKMYINAVELDNKNEQEFLSMYLLPLMSEEEIDDKVGEIVTQNSYHGIENLGNVMKEFNRRYNNIPHNKKEVATTARKWLLK